MIREYLEQKIGQVSQNEFNKALILADKDIKLNRINRHTKIGYIVKIMCIIIKLQRRNLNVITRT